jgi:pimeloyl-ACP methyl ester carboxylesterase
LNVLIAQPELNGTKEIMIIGHSEGTIIVPRVAVDNPTKVKNIVLISAQAENVRNNVYFQYFQYVYLPLLYAEKVLDHNHNDQYQYKKHLRILSFKVLLLLSCLLLLSNYYSLAKL